jgi:hypothetical protein
MQSGDFYEMGFTTQLYGREATDTLAEFAPPEIRTALKKQTERLRTILRTGLMPRLGTGGGYLWLLGVWSNPSPRRVCLIATPPDLDLMTIADGRKIEEAALRRASQKVRRQVEIMPRDIPDRELRKRIYANVQHRRPWWRDL